jgi:hypothetical protein
MQYCLGFIDRKRQLSNQLNELDWDKTSPWTSGKIREQHFAPPLDSVLRLQFMQHLEKKGPAEARP